MPELPEVETMVRALRPRVRGRRVARARLVHPDVLRGVTRPRLLQGLRGATVESLRRRAKHAVFGFDHGWRLVIQPGMTGSLVLHRTPPPPAALAHGVLRLTLDDGAELVYRDVRRLGTVRWLDRAAWRAYDRALGPEPLAPRFTPRVLAGAVGSSRQAIKKALMDQARLAGVGNIYAGEALFAAGIDPSTPADRLERPAWRRLHRAVRRILAAAIRSQGSTVRDYRTATGERGSFQRLLQVYGRAGRPCRRCGATLTGTHAIDGRITVFCHRCQG